jgi:hypothetical protein
MERMLRTIKLFARVTNASLGKMSTAPIPTHQRPPELISGVGISGVGLTDSEEVGTESKRISTAVVKSVGPGSEIDRVDEHEHEVKAVNKTAAEDCENVSCTVAMPSSVPRSVWTPIRTLETVFSNSGKLVQ